MSDWWSKKLAGEKPTAPRVSPTPPTQPVIKFPPMQQPTQQQGRQELLNPDRAPTENITMGEAIRVWKGGEAQRRDGGLSCPDCGSNNVFSRTGRGANSMVTEHNQHLVVLSVAGTDYMTKRHKRLGIVNKRNLHVRF